MAVMAIIQQDRRMDWWLNGVMVFIWCIAGVNGVLLFGMCGWALWLRSFGLLAASISIMPFLCSRFLFRSRAVGFAMIFRLVACGRAEL